MYLASSQYSKSLRLALGEKALSQKRIYLDQKYWIKLRQAKNGHPEDESDVEIYDLIQSLVKSGKVICPVSNIVFDETLRIPSPEVRLQHAEIIDLMSGKLAIQPSQVLDQLELTHFYKKHSIGEERCYPIEQMAWIFIGYILGECVPTNPAFDAETNNKIQIRFFEHMSHVSLVELIQSLDAPSRSAPDWDGLEHAKSATANEKAYEHEFTTYDEVFMSEVAGVLDGLSEDMRSLFIYLSENQVSEKTSQPSKQDLDESIRQMRNLIYHGFRLGRISVELPCIHILGGLHAAKRSASKANRGPYSKKGDIRDHLHARAALPYCDAFFTEKRLGKFLTEAPLKFNECYSCAILWENVSILVYLRTLS